MKQIPPSCAWLIPFLPTLLYFVATRLSFNELGTSIPLSCSPASTTIFPCQGNNNLLSLQHIQSFRDIRDILWKHDSELGRGYLLVSESNRIWRWEVGGGPIAIGTSLFLDHAGCRSKSNCDDIVKNGGGVGSMAIDFKDHDHANEGRLIVVERGEDRVIRLEDNGARTPLLGAAADRVVVLPNGDLWAVYRRKNEISRVAAAVHVPPLPNLTVSREAHFSEDRIHHSHPIDTVFQDESVQDIRGMVLSSTHLYISTIINGHAVIAAKSILEEEQESLSPMQVRCNMTEYGIVSVGDISLSDSGKLYSLTDTGLVVLDLQGSLLGSISLPEPMLHVCLGEDGYIYLSSRTRLYRMRTKEKPLQLPTDRIVKASIRLS